MSNRPAESAANSGANRDRPFDPHVVEQAESLAARYRIRVEPNCDGFVGTVTDMPTVFGYGPSEQAARSDARRHLMWALAYLIESGRHPSPK